VCLEEGEISRGLSCYENAGGLFEFAVCWCLLW